MSGWKPIAECPKSRSIWYLTCHSVDRWIRIGSWWDVYWYYASNCGNHEEPTHFMEIPSIPNAESRRTDEGDSVQ